MIKIKTNNKSILALMAILFGFIFGLYVWMPNTQPITAEEENYTTPIIPSIFNNSIIEFNENYSHIEIISGSSNEIVLGLSIEKYRSMSKDGPWEEADDLIGRIDVTPDGGTPYIFYKVVLNNTGNVDLDLELLDVYDGLELNLEDMLGYSLPSKIVAGETIEFSYKMAAYVGVHANIIYVSGLYDVEKVNILDAALYDGYKPSISVSNKEIPHFVVPEYNLGVLGGLGCMILAYISTTLQKRH